MDEIATLEGQVALHLDMSDRLLGALSPVEGTALLIVDAVATQYHAGIGLKRNTDAPFPSPMAMMASPVDRTGGSYQPCRLFPKGCMAVLARVNPLLMLVGSAEFLIGLRPNRLQI
jgi:hypothetical protein